MFILNKSFLLLGTVCLFCLTGCGELHNPSIDLSPEGSYGGTTSGEQALSNSNETTSTQEVAAKNMSIEEECVGSEAEVSHKAYTRLTVLMS